MQKKTKKQQIMLSQPIQSTVKPPKVDTAHTHARTHAHTHTRLTALFPGLPGSAGTRKVNQSGFY